MSAVLCPGLPGAAEPVEARQFDFVNGTKKKGVPKMAIPKEARLSIPEMGMASFRTLRDAKIALRRAGRKGSPRYANIAWAMLRRFGRD